MLINKLLPAMCCYGTAVLKLLVVIHLLKLLKGWTVLLLAR